ncbi:hypothetical protein BY996DRAFT_6428060 [Phakopsora pachyrhizi]|nr:hypothetical protein BY996DRAFT_6428060 [Phakopsora pachyrhizi]
MLQTIDPGTIRQILMRLEDTVVLCKLFCPKTPTSPPTSTTTTVLQQTPIEQQQQQQQQQQQFKSDTKNFRIQGWDPILIIAQILAIQSLHYLILSLLTPPMLQLLSSPFPLDFEGGPSSLAMIMDWREMIGIGTINQSLNFNKQQQQQASLRPWANSNYIHSKVLLPSLDRKLSRINSFVSLSHCQGANSHNDDELEELYRLLSAK